MLAEALHGTYASTIIVENKAGASARLAVEYVKNAPPDGSVLLFTPDFPMTLYPHSFKLPRYDPLKDLIAVFARRQGHADFRRRPGGSSRSVLVRQNLSASLARKRNNQ